MTETFTTELTGNRRRENSNRSHERDIQKTLNQIRIHAERLSFSGA